MPNLVPNAYTVGNAESYDFALAEESNVFKTGALDDPEAAYEGGWVWRTRSAAERFFPDMAHDFGKGPVKLKVYGLVLTTSWKRDVSAEPAEDGVHRLLNRARIVQLP